MNPQPTAHDALIFCLGQKRKDGTSWKDSLFQAYFDYALKGNATYARIIINALSHQPLSKREVVKAAKVAESTDPLTFHSELRAFMMKKGRMLRFIEAMMNHAIKGKSAFGRFIEKLAQLKPPTEKDIEGNVLVIDEFGGRSVIPLAIYDQLEAPVSTPQEPPAAIREYFQGDKPREQERVLVGAR